MMEDAITSVPELALRAEAHDLEDQVVALFGQMREKLLRYLWSLRLPVDDSEEVIQEVFLALFRHLKRGRPGHNLRGWIFQVAHNLALKRRDENFRRPVGVEAAAEPEDVRVAANPEQRFLTEQRQARLYGVWRALPEKDRLCVALRAEGLTYREIAEVLKISLGSVAASLGRSVAKLATVDQR